MNKKLKTAILCGVEGRGETVAAAKAHAAAILSGIVERVADGAEPVAVMGRGAFIYPNLEGWTFQVITKRDGSIAARGCLRLYPTYPTRFEALAAAQYRLAQTAWSSAVDDAAFCDEVFPELRMTIWAAAHAKLLKWCAAQRKYGERRLIG
jgi:hypothetical protein